MLYLVHPDGEVVTEISHRQDVNQRGTMAGYWFPLHYLAVRDRNGQYAALARSLEPASANLATLMDYPEIAGDLPPSVPLPDHYERALPAVGAARIRRGRTSATLILRGNSIFFGFRRGEAVVNAVRMASAFFGKGQLVPSGGSKVADHYEFEQVLTAGYYQPVDAPVGTRWEEVWRKRRQSEICTLTQRASVRETASGFQVQLLSDGTAGVPVAVEIGLRPGGALDGCEKVNEEIRLLASGWATYRVGGDTIRFGPGLGLHRWTQIRGAHPKLPGLSVYLCGFTPFSHTVGFEVS